VNEGACFRPPDPANLSRRAAKAADFLRAILGVERGNASLEEILRREVRG
jgi:hypothetical protein